MIPFKMMYNTSMLRHRFSNERWGARPERYSVEVCILFRHGSIYFIQLTLSKYIENHPQW